MSTPFESRYEDFGAGPVHVADFGGEGRSIVCVHGLGGSHLNWMAIAKALTGLGHVTAIDLIGSGLTPPAGRNAGIGENRAVVDAYLRSLGRPVKLVGNSMGGTIAVLQAGQAPETVDSLVLVSPAVPPTVRGHPSALVGAAFAAYMIPGIGELTMALRSRIVGPEETLLWVLRLCAHRPDLIPSEILEAHLDLARRRSHMAGAGAAFLESARSLLIHLLRRRHFDDGLRRVRAPTLVMAGLEDPLVDHRAIRRIMGVRPDWQYEYFGNVGHIAMLEDPETVTTKIDTWLTGSAR